jgi:hypothetical protein
MGDAELIIGALIIGNMAIRTITASSPDVLRLLIAGLGSLNCRRSHQILLGDRGAELVVVLHESVDEFVQAALEYLLDVAVL